MPAVSANINSNAEHYRRALLGRAMNLARSADVAEDLVQAAFDKALQLDPDVPVEETLFFLFSIMSHEWLNEWRKRRTRARTISSEDLGPSVDRIQRLSVKPAQQPNTELAEALRELEKLPPLQQDILKLRAMEFTDDEIATRLKINRKTAKRHGDIATAILRQAAGLPELTAADPRGRIGFRGVSRCGGQYQAYQGVGPNRLYLGLHDTPEEAALAYDLAALWRMGDDALLNFPELRQDLQARLDRGEIPTAPKRADGKVHRNQKLLASDIPGIRKRIAAGEPQKAIAKDYDVHFNVISEIKRGTRWAHVP